MLQRKSVFFVCIMFLHNLERLCYKGKVLSYSFVFLRRTFPISVVIAYKEGMTNSVISVANASPKIIVFAIGVQIGDFPPNPSDIGISPNMVVNEVSIMGRRRILPPFSIAYHLLKPRSRYLLIKSMSTIESLTTIPASATIPNIATRLSVALEKSNPTIAPIMPNGTAKRMMMGCVHDLNCAPSIT